MDDSARLSSGELAVLDALITVAQEAGLRIDDTDDDWPVGNGAAEPGDNGGNGDETSEAELIPKVRELTGQLGSTTTLRTLIELRARAVRKQ